MLTLKQKKFVLFYLGKANGNGTLAATLAGYGSPEVEASRLLRNAKVRRSIDARLDKAAMDSDEVLIRLSRLAAVDPGNFLAFNPDADPNAPPSLDLRKAKRKDNLVGIKKIKQTSSRIPMGPGQPPIETREIDVEIEPPLKALALLMKYHGLLEPKADAEDMTTKTDEELDDIARGKGKR